MTRASGAAAARTGPQEGVVAVIWHAAAAEAQAGTTGPPDVVIAAAIAGTATVIAALIARRPRRGEQPTPVVQVILPGWLQPVYTPPFLGHAEPEVAERRSIWTSWVFWGILLAGVVIWVAAANGAEKDATSAVSGDSGNADPDRPSAIATPAEDPETSGADGDGATGTNGTNGSNGTDADPPAVYLNSADDADDTVLSSEEVVSAVQRLVDAYTQLVDDTRQSRVASGFGTYFSARVAWYAAPEPLARDELVEKFWGSGGEVTRELDPAQVTDVCPDWAANPAVDAPFAVEARVWYRDLDVDGTVPETPTGFEDIVYSVVVDEDDYQIRIAGIRRGTCL